MAIIYVRTTGNDTTGNGLTGAPYKTLVKALTVAVAGDTILMGAGTYAEDSGAGYLYLNNLNYASYVRIEPESGINDVVITGTSATYAMQIASASRIMFRRVTFRSQDQNVTNVTRFVTANMSSLKFIECIYQVIGKSAVTNVAIGSAWTSGTVTISDIEFVGCTVEQIGAYYVAGILLDASGLTNRPSDIRIINHKSIIGSFGIRMMGVSRFLIANADCISFDPAISVNTIQVGEDNYTGTDITGVIINPKSYSVNGHGMVIGGGCSDIHLDRGVIIGGANSSSGQGLVIKNATGYRVSNVSVVGGYLSTLYIKAASGGLVEKSGFYARFSTASALRVGANSENNSKAGNNAIRQNYFYGYSSPIFNWQDIAGDSGGNVCDQNVYAARGTATLGSVYGTTVSSIAGIRAAWAGYDMPGNDSISRIGQTAISAAGNMTAA